MALNKKKLAAILEKKLKDDKTFQNALKIMEANSDGGKIWLIGGAVYQNLANRLYGRDNSPKDYDFILENKNEEIMVPFGWTKQNSSLNGHRLIESFGEGIIDFVSLDEVYSINQRHMTPHISNFLSGTPLNIQSMAYEVHDKTLEGHEGIDSLEKKLVRAYNLEMAKEYAQMKNSNVNKYIVYIAKKINFTAELLNRKKI